MSGHLHQPEEQPSRLGATNEALTMSSEGGERQLVSSRVSSFVQSLSRLGQ